MASALNFTTNDAMVAHPFLDHAQIIEVELNQAMNGSTAVLAGQSGDRIQWEVGAMDIPFEIASGTGRKTPILTTMKIEQIPDFSLKKSYQISQIDKDSRPSVTEILTNEKRYTYENGAWTTVAKELGLNPDSIIAAARQAKSQGRELIIFEVGVGKADALEGLSALLRDNKIDNVHLVGLSRDYYPAWERINDDRITLIWDHSFNIDKYKKYLRGVSLTFSRKGITPMLRINKRESLEFFRDIAPLMEYDGAIVFDAETSDRLTLEDIVRGTGLKCLILGARITTLL